MINDDNMDTTNAIMDKEQFSKEELLPIDQEDEENNKVCNCNTLNLRTYILLLCVCNVRGCIL